MVAATIQSAWAEVKKSNPCPLCGKPDWCSVSDNGEAVLCRRLDPGSQPPDWKHIKDSSDGFPICALDKGEQFFKSFKPIKRIPPLANPEDFLVAKRTQEGWEYLEGKLTPEREKALSVDFERSLRQKEREKERERDRGFDR